MKLIFIYGAPGVGKMTVANKLSHYTGFKLFHLHHTIDYVRNIFPRHVLNSEVLVDKFCYEMIEFAAKNNINIIFTYVYAKDVDDYFVKKIIKIIKKYKSHFFFVQLKCDEAINLKRLLNKERRKYAKITSVSEFRKLRNRYNILSNIDYVNNFIIDNSKINSSATAKLIIKHFNLVDK